MLNKTKLTQKEIRAFAEAFADYKYEKNDEGMVHLFPGYPDTARVVKYIEAIIKTANEADAIYSTSPDNEGIIIVSTTLNPFPASKIIKMLFRMIRALGIKNFSSTMNYFQAGGASLEKKYRSNKLQFAQIELCCVRKEYQGKGFMRSLIETAIEIADASHLPLIVTTDAEIKKEKYAHLGLSPVNVREICPGSYFYDLERVSI